MTTKIHSNENYTVLLNDGDTKYTLHNNKYGIDESQHDHLVEALYAAEQFDYAIRTESYKMEDEHRNPLLSLVRKDDSPLN